MSESTVQLDYAKPPRWHRRMWLGRAIILIALMTGGVAAWRRGPEKWERAKLLYWQWRCMNFTAPAEEVVFDRNPAGKSELLDGRLGYATRQTYYGYSGPPLTEALRIPRCEERFAALANGSTWASGQNPVLFMHERTAPSGYRYLIILRGADILEHTLNVGQLSAYPDSFKPGDWQSLPVPTDPGHSREDFYPLWLPAPTRLRIYAGQVDAKKADHFTIRYEEEGRTKTVDGFVDDAPVDDRLEPGVRQVRVRLSEETAR
jgi:hypothetical protein